MKKRNSKALHQIVQYLEDSIARGEYLPGEKLNMADIAAKLSVSRIPVSEAFQYMGKQGLIELIDNRGAFVKKYTIQEAFDIYEVWTQLELLACQMAAGNINKSQENQINKNLAKQAKAVDEDNFVEFTYLNKEFHMLICQISGNGFLVELMENVLNRAAIFRMLSLLYPMRMHESYAQHQELLECIKAKDRDAIEKMVYKHMETGFIYLKKKNDMGNK